MVCIIEEVSLVFCLVDESFIGGEKIQRMCDFKGMQAEIYFRLNFQRKCFGRKFVKF